MMFYEGKMYKYILSDDDAASRYKVAKPLTTKKSSKVAFTLGAVYKKKKGGSFKYPKAFQIDNGSEFKGEVTKLLEKHNVDIQRATTKHKYTHSASVESSNKVLEDLSDCNGTSGLDSL